MSATDLGWIFSGMGILGAILNLKKKRLSFLVWGVGNAGWLTLGILVPEMKAQIPLWITFIILNIWGYFEWRK